MKEAGLEKRQTISEGKRSESLLLSPMTAVSI